MMKFKTDDILALYRSEAAKHGSSGTSTIQDIRTRVLELNAISGYLKEGTRVLEVGCGNGYVAEQLVREFDIDLDAFDYSDEMIRIAEQRDLKQIRGRVRFWQGDVLELDKRDTYDHVFSERCIQNLVSWEKQKVAMENICRAMKAGGEYIMLESFWTGLNNLNAARQELGLDEIKESWHNLFFVEKDVIAHMESIGLDYVDQDPFLSGYYFGSRVLLPALLPDPAKANSKSILNDFFCGLSAAGDFSPMKIVRFRKRV